MKKYFIRTKEFWTALLIRAIRTFFQSFCGCIVSAKLLQDVDWMYVLSASLMATILALGMGLKGLPEVNED